MRVALSHQNRCVVRTLQTGLPDIARRDVPSGQQRRHVAQRSAVRNESRKPVFRKPDRLPDSVDQRSLNGRRPRPHFLNGHHLIGHGTNRIEQPGDRHRSRHLMPDVPRIVQVVAASEHLLRQRFEPVSQRLRAGLK